MNNLIFYLDNRVFLSTLDVIVPVSIKQVRYLKAKDYFEDMVNNLAKSYDPNLFFQKLVDEGKFHPSIMKYDNVKRSCITMCYPYNHRHKSEDEILNLHRQIVEWIINVNPLVKEVKTDLL